MLESVNFLGSYLALLYLYVRTTMNAIRLTRARDPSREGEGKAKSPLPPSHWTGAASKDVFLQASKTLQSLRVSVAPFVLLTWLAAFLSHIITWAIGNPVSAPEFGVDLVCPQGVNLCRAAWHGDVLVFATNVSCLVYLLIIMVLCPEDVWGPVMLAAIKQTGEWRMARMRTLPALMMFPLIMDMLILINYSVFDPTVTPVTQDIVFFANIVVVLYQTGVMVWLFLPLWAPPPTTDQEAAAEIGHLAMTSGWQSSADVPPRCLFQRLAVRLRKGLTTRESGVRVRREALMIVLASMLTQRETFDLFYTIPVLMVMLWSMRIAAFLLIVLIRDETAGFDTLMESGAAFGLVVDLNDLCKAVYHLLKRHTPLPVRVRTYKGSLTRMQQTMTISYRWQEDEQAVAQGLSLNMSDWQLHSLLDAMVSTNCKYIWLDRISVPQVGGVLQETLLSRMMAVYAASGCTLVLRSREPDGSRYHQRGWTVQEFCSCSKAAVKTEPVSLASMMAVRRSRLRISVHTSAETPDEDEERYFQSLREWHLARSLSCKPLWLCHDSIVSDEHLETAVVKFIDLASRVATQEPKDLVRALVPMLANCPVETQDELVELLRLMDTKVNSPSIQQQMQLFISRPRKPSILTSSFTAGIFSSFYTTTSTISHGHRGSMNGAPSHGRPSMGDVTAGRPSNASTISGLFRINVEPQSATGNDVEANLSGVGP